MTTNRDLLEMSAKAIGCDFNFQGLDRAIPVLIVDGEPKAWMPLNWNSDALELAVELFLKIEQFPKSTSNNYPAHVIVRCWTGPHNGYQAIQEHGNDALAATRLAIVMVAAEIGRRKP